MSVVVLPINGVKSVESSTKLPTRETKICSANISGRVICYDDNGTLKPLSQLCAVAQRPTHVFIGDSVTTANGVSRGLFAILGADGIIEIDVADGASISVGDEVLSDANGKIVSRPANSGGESSEDRWPIGIALDATSETIRRIRVNTKVVLEEITLPAQN